MKPTKDIFTMATVRTFFLMPAMVLAGIQATSAQVYDDYGTYADEGGAGYGYDGYGDYDYGYYDDDFGYYDNGPGFEIGDNPEDSWAKTGAEERYTETGIGGDWWLERGEEGSFYDYYDDGFYEDDDFYGYEPRGYYDPSDYYDDFYDYPYYGDADGDLPYWADEPEVWADDDRFARDDDFYDDYGYYDGADDWWTEDRPWEDDYNWYSRFRNEGDAWTDEDYTNEYLDDISY